ncbi:MAG: response regulator [Candidatus Latescibacteria bacterium]|jgi:DNA-binding response OmpR family regulator|nr:response regulator [Candidatus Latescibacterota bacterium]
MSEDNVKEKPKILIVDDTRLMRSIVGQIFIENGHRVIEAENGEDALFMAGQFLPDLIVMDINMPKKTGIEALRELRQDERFADTAVVMLTSEQDRNTIMEALQGGASDYIVKNDIGTCVKNFNLISIC